MDSYFTIAVIYSTFLPMVCVLAIVAITLANLGRQTSCRCNTTPRDNRTPAQRTLAWRESITMAEVQRRIDDHEKLRAERREEFYMKNPGLRP